jgi:hypothetical protein
MVSELCALTDAGAVRSLLGGAPVDSRSTDTTCAWTGPGGATVGVRMVTYADAAQAAHAVTGATRPVPGLEAAVASAWTLHGSSGEAQVAVGPTVLISSASGVAGLGAALLGQVVRPIVGV